MFQEKQYNELRARATIDVLKLDEELSQQPMLLLSAAEWTADAIRVRDEAKHQLDISVAEAARKLRVANDDGKAPSEQKVASLIPLDTAVQELEELLAEAKRDVAYWQALVDSFNDKGSALRRIAELTTSGYLTPNDAYQQRRREMQAERDLKWRPR